MKFGAAPPFFCTWWGGAYSDLRVSLPLTAVSWQFADGPQPLKCVRWDFFIVFCVNLDWSVKWFLICHFLLLLERCPSFFILVTVLFFHSITPVIPSSVFLWCYFCFLRCLFYTPRLFLFSDQICQCYSFSFLLRTSLILSFILKQHFYIEFRSVCH